MYQKLFPSACASSFAEIDFKALYEKGYDIILTDLDNTLCSYDTLIPSKKLMSLIEELKEIGFQIYIISNGSKKRVTNFANVLELPFLAKAHKPLKGRLKKFAKLNKIDFSRSVFIGDQLMTDIYLASKLNLYSIYLNPIDPSFEYKRTRINRKLERYFKKKMFKKQPTRYIEIFGDLDE